MSAQIQTQSEVKCWLEYWPVCWALAVEASLLLSSQNVPDDDGLRVLLSVHQGTEGHNIPAHWKHTWTLGKLRCFILNDPQHRDELCSSSEWAFSGWNLKKARFGLPLTWWEVDEGHALVAESLNLLELLTAPQCNATLVKGGQVGAFRRPSNVGLCPTLHPNRKKIYYISHTILNKHGY